MHHFPTKTLMTVLCSGAAVVSQWGQNWLTPL